MYIWAWMGLQILSGQSGVLELKRLWTTLIEPHGSTTLRQYYFTCPTQDFWPLTFIFWLCWAAIAVDSNWWKRNQVLVMMPTNCHLAHAVIRLFLQLSHGSGVHVIDEGNVKLNQAGYSRWWSGWRRWGMRAALTAVFLFLLLLLLK